MVKVVVMAKINKLDSSLDSSLVRVRSKEEIKLEEDLIRQIGSIDFILHGLEGNEAFNCLLDIFRENVRVADDAWHLTSENSKEFQDIRIKKLAAEFILNALPTMKQTLEKLQSELIKAQNPDLFINKDYE